MTSVKLFKLGHLLLQKHINDLAPHLLLTTNWIQWASLCQFLHSMPTPELWVINYLFTDNCLLTCWHYYIPRVWYQHIFLKWHCSQEASFCHQYYSVQPISYGFLLLTIAEWMFQSLKELCSLCHHPVVVFPFHKNRWALVLKQSTANHIETYNMQ